jgi:hypothetical protein
VATRAGARHLGRVAERATRRAAKKGEPWTDRAARAGYVARGFVYVLFGGFALAAAAGLGGKPTDPTGALSALARLPAGRVALAVVALGLLVHAGFRGMLVLTGEPHPEHGRWRRVAMRVRHGFAACLYAGMALTAAALAAGRYGQAHADKDVETRHLSARLLAAPFGRPILVMIAVGIGVAAAVWIARAFGPNRPSEGLRVEAMTQRQRTLMAVLARVAYVARATVLAACGYFLARGAVDRAPRETRGPAGALRAVWQLPHGRLLLALVAAGLVAFGLYGMLEARWRRLFAH